MNDLLKQVLIVDDDIDHCNLLKTLLGKSIPDVSSVHTIEMGRNFINMYRPDIVFLDNNLPDGQGVELIGQIKSLSPASQGIMISAMGNMKEESIKWGADVIIEKPLTSSNVFKALEKLQLRI